MLNKTGINNLEDRLKRGLMKKSGILISLIVDLLSPKDPKLSPPKQIE